jgi:hypothetical protein
VRTIDPYGGQNHLPSIPGILLLGERMPGWCNLGSPCCLLTAGEVILKLDYLLSGSAELISKLVIRQSG